MTEPTHTQPSAPVLAIDLDGTLLRSDMLFETFWSSISTTIQQPLKSVQEALGGKAALKRLLATHSNVDPATLPYNEGVLRYIEDWRGAGGRVVLVTASDQALADDIAAHLGLFDEVHGSDGRKNLKGHAKAEFLVARFGEKGFVYMGDSRCDVDVWRHAAKAVTVNASADVKRKASALGIACEHIVSEPESFKPYVKAMRPHQWLKNILIFLPMLAAHQFNLETLWQGSLAFLAFSLMASGVYVLNDLLDLHSDRAHPRKRRRPFASGAASLMRGSFMAPMLIAAGAGLSAILGERMLLVIAIYFVFTTAYSLWLKRQMVLDICLLSMLYTIRIVAGGTAMSIPLSVWLLAFSMFFFFSLAAVKRQAELVDMRERGEILATGRGYHVDDLPIISMMGISSGYVAVVIMAFYVNSEAMVALYHEPTALWGICFVLLYWITHMVMVTHRGEMHDDPVVYAVTDRLSQICGFFVLLFVVAGVVL